MATTRVKWVEKKDIINEATSRALQELKIEDGILCFQSKTKGKVHKYIIENNKELAALSQSVWLRHANDTLREHDENIRAKKSEQEKKLRKELLKKQHDDWIREHGFDPESDEGQALLASDRIVLCHRTLTDLHRTIRKAMEEVAEITKHLDVWKQRQKACFERMGITSERR